MYTFLYNMVRHSNFKFNILFQFYNFIYYKIYNAPTTVQHDLHGYCIAKIRTKFTMLRSLSCLVRYFLEEDIFYQKIVLTCEKYLSVELY
jgi:hypothetical protein